MELFPSVYVKAANYIGIWNSFHLLLSDSVLKKYFKTQCYFFSDRGTHGFAVYNAENAQGSQEHNSLVKEREFTLNNLDLNSKYMIYFTHVLMEIVP